MGSKDLVSEEVLQELITKLEEIVNNYCWNLESFTDEDINSLFQADSQEITYYNSLINDNIESKNFLWSSKKIAEKIAESIIKSSEYTNNLIKNMSSIQLEWCETDLPSIGEANKIYVLPTNNGTDTVNTLNIWNSTTCEFISIGNLEIDLTNYYTKTETDEKLELKANADEVISNDKIVQTLDSTSVTDQIPSAKAVYDSCIKDSVKIYTHVKQLGLDNGCSVGDIFNAMPVNSLVEMACHTMEWCDDEGASYVTDVPEPYVLLTIRKYVSNTTSRFTIIAKRSNRDSLAPNIMWIGQLKGFDGSGLTWAKVCTTTVEDVDKTLITTQNLLTGSISYYIKNGLCYVSVSSITPNSNSGLKIGETSSLPNPDTRGVNHHVVGTTSGVTGLFVINTDGSITFYGKNTLSYFGQFSYPVAGQ